MYGIVINCFTVRRIIHTKNVNLYGLLSARLCLMKSFFEKEISVSLAAVVILMSIVGATTSRATAASGCWQLFEKESQPVVGIIETRIQSNELRIAEMNMQVDSLISALDQGGNGWNALSPNLVNLVTSAVKKYTDAQNKEIKKEAHKEIMTALRNSTDFKTDDTYMLVEAALSVVQSNVTSLHQLNGVKHTLYIQLAETKIVNSAEFNSILDRINSIGENVKKVLADNSQLDIMLKWGGVNDAATLSELKLREDQIKNSILNSLTPPKLAKQLALVAQEYQTASQGSSDGLTAGQYTAIKKYEKLVQKSPYFAKLTDSEINQFSLDWFKATTQTQAMSLLLQNLPPRVAQAMQHELYNVRKAIDYFESNEIN